MTTIGIDIDGTWTAASAVLSPFVYACKLEKTYQAYYVTNRHESDGIEDVRPSLSRGIPVIFCGNTHKRIACERQGICIDIWIDDNPGTIEPSKILEDAPEESL